MEFGQMLKQLREGRGLTQVALAEKSGISLRTIQGWEQGKRSPVSPLFFRLISALGVPAEAFAGVASETTRKPKGKRK